MLVENNPQQKYKNPSAWACVGGFFAGLGTQSLVGIASLPIGLSVLDKLKQISDLPDDEFKQVEVAVDKALKDSGLSEKGVTIRKIPTVEAKSFFDKIQALTKPSEAAKQGKNAYYMPSYIEILTKHLPKEAIKDITPKTIYVPEKVLSLTRFHEMGHAANEQFSKTGKFLQKCRPLSMFAPFVILVVGLCKTKKAPNEKPKSTTDRINTFIKNNAGKLTLLAMLPMLAEEAMASINGCKFAKKAGLSKELLAKVYKTNKTAYLAYLLTVVTASVGAYAAIKVKDAIAHKTPKKVKPKVEA